MKANESVKAHPCASFDTERGILFKYHTLLGSIPVDYAFCNFLDTGLVEALKEGKVNSYKIFFSL